jgi:hypothetical protein
MKLVAYSILSKFLFLFLSLFLTALPTAAQTEFETTSEITYQLGSRGNAQVTQKIGLVNNFSHIFPKEYQLNIIGNKIENISAEDSGGSILNKVVENENETIITLAFNEPEVGKDKKTEFFVNYEIPDLGKKRGQIWEINIPSLSNVNQFNNLNLTIKIPEPFGSLSFSSVKPYRETITDGQIILEYQKKQLQDNQILLAFGDFQIFNFNLNFSLFNNSPQSVNKTIPIPPDTSYQNVFLTSIDPKPIKIFTDDDYNWLALYSLEGGEQLEVNVQGQAKIFSGPDNQNFTKLYDDKPLDAYLKDDQYWQVDSPTIQDLGNYFTNANQVYDFVVSELDYDYENLEQSQRKGALQAIKDKGGVCTEFSDLFVALSRASGIPSRELQGFAFTSDKKLFTLSAENDVLHSWVEYWDSDKGLWIPADPTWAKTTEGIDFINNFDLGHFVFVVHGHSSTKPAPPGFYKDNNLSKNVNVEFAQKLLPKPEPSFEVEFIKDNDQTSSIKIINSSFSPTYDVNVNLVNWKKNKEDKVIKVLPPLGEVIYEVKNPGFFQRIFSEPSYLVVINQKEQKIEFPTEKLNFKQFFDNLWRQLFK